MLFLTTFNQNIVRHFHFFVFSRLGKAHFRFFSGTVTTLCNGIITLLAVSIPILIVVFLGTGWDSIIQLVLLALFIGAMFDYFIGTFIHPSVEKQMQGVTGYNGRAHDDGEAR